MIVCVAFGQVAFGQASNLLPNTSAVGSSRLYDLSKAVSKDPFRFSCLPQPFKSTEFVMSRIPAVDHLPSLFCKLEYKLEGKSKLAPRFRLGSLQYTDWMEGKNDFLSRFYK